MRLEQASHNAIVRCVFSQMRKRSQWAGARIWKDSQYNTLRQCSFSKWGWYTDDDKGCLLDIGNENSKVEQTAYNPIEGCEFFHGGHHLVGVYSKCNVFRNNYFHNENWLKDDAGKNLWGNRNLMTSGFDECSGRNLFEETASRSRGIPGQPRRRRDGPAYALEYRALQLLLQEQLGRADARRDTQLHILPQRQPDLQQHLL